MSAEIRNMNGVRITLEEAQSAPAITELLGDLTVENTAGNIRALVVAVVRSDGRVDTRWRWQPGGSLFEVIGAMELLKLDILHSINVQAVPTPPAEPA